MPTNPFQDFKISNYPISLTFELIKKADSSNGGTTGGGSTAKPDEEIVLPEQPEEIPTADNEHENQNDPVNDTEIKDENDNHGIPNGVPNTGDLKRSYLLLGSLSFGLLLLCIYINNKTILEK